MIGVDPRRQGEGLGSALLEYSLRIVDRDGVLAYLEATSTRSKALYERFGFSAVGVIQAADSPPMWPMVRQPQR
jgi:ribosomal protein S18 acetylase RimI-like enzyme